MNTGFQRMRVAVVLLVAGLLLALATVSFGRRAGAVEPRIGVEWAQSSSGPIAVHLHPEGAAALAGLREGDLLLEVEGREVKTALEAAELGWSSGAEGPVTVHVRRAGAELPLTIGPTWQRRTEPYVYLVIIGLAFWLSGLFIAVRWPMIRGGTVYALLSACLFAHLTLSHSGVADRLDWAIYWTDLIAGALWPALLLHVGVAMTKRTLRWRRAVLGVAYGLATVLVFAAVWLSPAAWGGAYRFTEPVLAVEIRDRLEVLALALSMLITMVLLLKSHARSSSVMHRSQMRWMLWGLAVGFGPFVLLYGVPWALGAAELPEWARFLALAPMLLVPATFTAALARYRLHDLDLLLLRGFSEVTAVFVTFAVLAATVFLLREGVSELIPLSRSATRYIGFLVAAVAYSQLRRWVRAGVERAFYKQRYSYRATLLDWARELNTETDLSSLLGRLRSRIRDTLGVAEAEVLVRTGPWSFEPVGESEALGRLELDEASLEQLDRDASIELDRGTLPGIPWAAYLFALKVKGRLRAVLAIAERQSPDEPLTTEDRALLGTLAAHAGTAIEAARLMQEVRQRADEIERLHARQARILESSAVGLLLLDGDGKILAWNRALEAIYGLSREEAIGRRLAEVFPLHVARRIEREGQEAPHAEGSRKFRLVLTNQKEQRLILNIAISPADDGSGDGGGRVVTFDDVTERVELEEQMLRQERLASLGLLAAGVAHEINTPLTGISSYAQLLLEETERDDPSKAVLDKIEKQTQRASKIANSLLTLARPERQTFEALDLNETLREALQLFEPQVRGKRIRLRARLDESLAPIRGHRGKLQQVFLNLLLNARDAVGSDGEITVATSGHGGWAVVEVVDDGTGIPEENLPRIFDPFFTTNGRGKGTGLGLAITYGIVAEHDGRIRAECDPGGLTRFRVELPEAGRARATG